MNSKQITSTSDSTFRFDNQSIFTLFLPLFVIEKKWESQLE